MLDKYIKLFLEVSFADILKQVDDENKLQIQKAKEKQKKKEKEEISREVYSDLLNYSNTNASQRLPRSHLANQRRPRSKS